LGPALHCNEGTRFWRRSNCDRLTLVQIWKWCHTRNHMRGRRSFFGHNNNQHSPGHKWVKSVRNFPPFIQSLSSSTEAQALSQTLSSSSHSKFTIHSSHTCLAMSISVVSAPQSVSTFVPEGVWLSGKLGFDSFVSQDVYGRAPLG